MATFNTYMANTYGRGLDEQEQGHTMQQLVMMCDSSSRLSAHTDVRAHTAGQRQQAGLALWHALHGMAGMHGWLK